MAGKLEQPRLAADIQTLLSGLRFRIRSYVWGEGISIALAWLGLMFWLVLVIDYGPVAIGKWFGGLIPALAGLPESSVGLRAFLLLIVLGTLGFIVYWWILRRAFVDMADHSMALLLERRFDQFHDGLVTSVELAEQTGHAADFDQDMLAHTHDDAASRVGQVQLRQVFNFSPLSISAGAWIFFAVTILVLAIADSGFLARAAGRMYLLSSDPWPRSTRIEVIGIEVAHSLLSEEIDLAPPILKFGDGPVKVAKGSSVTLKVQANANMVIPEVCTIIYHNEDGDSGRQNMKKIGRPREGYQQYAFDGKPFKGILSSMEFDVVGFDHRISGYHIEVVDNPAVVDTQLECVFPKYMVDKESGSWTPRTIPWTSGIQLPAGTKIKVHAKSNKPLKFAHVQFGGASGKKGPSETIEVEGDDLEQFEFDVPPLRRDLSVEVTLHDTDEVVAETPHRIYITAIPDDPPRVHAFLRGIGTAVTPIVRIPIEGTITDDYGVKEAWIDVEAPDLDLYEHPVELTKTGEAKLAIDFRDIRDRETDPFELVPGEDAKLVITAKAADHFDLGDEENIGDGERYELDIVTPDQLLAILEREEAGQRRRVEQIFAEMNDARDWLLRVRTDGLAGEASGAEPEDERQPGDEKEDAEKVAERIHSLRLLFTQRALLQSRKSQQETLGVAGTFRDIRDQIINNRVDAEDRKERLKKYVADPLQHIGDVMFADLELQIEALETKLKQLEKDLKNEKLAKESAEAVDAAVAQAEDLLAELEKVLQNLIKFESYAELLDIVRDLIADQEKIIDETKKEQKRDLLE